MNSKESVGQHDLVDLTDDNVAAGTQHGAADFAAENSLLDESLRIILACGGNGIGELARNPYLADAERRPGACRFDEDRVGELIGVDVSMHTDNPEVRRGDPRASGDGVRE